MDALQKAVIIQNLISNLTQVISEDIDAPIKLVNLEGNFAHLKSQKTDNQPTIGYMHSLLERLKRGSVFPIKEYSCSQATLEQIFYQFATE